MKNFIKIVLGVSAIAAASQVVLSDNSIRLENTQNALIKLYAECALKFNQTDSDYQRNVEICIQDLFNNVHVEIKNPDALGDIVKIIEGRNDSISLDSPTP